MCSLSGHGLVEVDYFVQMLEVTSVHQDEQGIHSWKDGDLALTKQNYTKGREREERQKPSRENLRKG